MSERYEGNVRLVRVAPSGGYHYERIALETDEHLVWIEADGYPATTTRGHIGDRRQLVVIDPEDRDGARLLLEAYGRQSTDWTPELDTNVTRLQAALREYADPKPTEPTGVGAVVREGADVWVLARVGYADPWRAVTGDDHRTRSWSSFSSGVEVLSEGVQQ